MHQIETKAGDSDPETRTVAMQVAAAAGGEGVIYICLYLLTHHDSRGGRVPRAKVGLGAALPAAGRCSAAGSPQRGEHGDLRGHHDYRAHQGRQELQLLLRSPTRPLQVPLELRQRTHHPPRWHAHLRHGHAHRPTGKKHRVQNPHRQTIARPGTDRRSQAQELREERGDSKTGADRFGCSI